MWQMDPIVSLFIFLTIGLLEIGIRQGPYIAFGCYLSVLISKFPLRFPFKLIM